MSEIIDLPALARFLFMGDGQHRPTSQKMMETSMKKQEALEPQTNFDPARRYVRVCKRRDDGFVEFEFSIGEPALAVELMLPETAFHEFCLANEVILLEPASGEAADWVARLNQASLRDIEDAAQ